MHTPHRYRTEEPSQSGSQPERTTPNPSLLESPDGVPAASHEALQAEWKRVENSLPKSLGLRVHRALSWLERAENEPEDPDAAFIFYWIAFNAAYAKDRPHSIEYKERSQFADFFDTILSLDSNQTIYNAIWKRFSNSIRLLLDNKFVFQPFWEYHAGRGWEDWESSFESSKTVVGQALAARNTGVVLSTLFDRLYVLRIQLMHGGASWDSSVNRDQVRDGARILAFLVPIFIELMMSRPDVEWGPPDYPVVG